MSLTEHATTVDPVPVAFTAGGGDAVTGRLELVEVRGGGDVRLTVLVDAAALEQVRAGALFHLGPDTYDAADLEFGSTAPITLVLGAGPVLAGELPAGAAEILDAFLSGDAPAAWRDEAAWHALEVSQAVDLPAELDDGSARLRKGFETEWARGRDAAAGIYEAARAVVSGWGLPFEELELDGYPVLHLEPGARAPWDCYLIAKGDLGQVGFYSVLPDLVPEERRAAVMELVTRANYGMELGNFEMDLDDGEVRMKSVLVVDGPDGVTALLDRIVDENLALTMQYRDDIAGAAGS